MDTEKHLFVVGLKSKKIKRKDIKEIRELKEVIKKNYKYQNKKLYFSILIIILIYTGIIYFIYHNYKEINPQNSQIKYNLFKNETKEQMINKINILENKIENLNLKLNGFINYAPKSKNEENINNNIGISRTELSEVSFEKFDENVLQEIKKQQMEFCNDQTKYIKEEFEKQIILAKANLLDKAFNMYVYKKDDALSFHIKRFHKYESTETQKIIKALNYYSSVKNIPNNNIYILDIGANVGWYTFFLGSFGYQILSFEASDINMYILRKNFCLNPNFNITLIKKALYSNEKKCDYYIHRGNIGNGLIFCDENFTLSNEFFKSGETYLTKLSNYIDFLSTKNLALIKIDIEGSEGKAIESGVELISNYHVPFIFLEFTPKLLKIHGINPMQFLEIFEMNGYKFAKDNFFDNNYYNKYEIIEKTEKKATNLFIVYSNIIANSEINH